MTYPIRGRKKALTLREVSSYVRLITSDYIETVVKLKKGLKII